MTCAAYSEFAPLKPTAEDRVFILTGAGISAESGIRTFRDGNGLWENHDVMSVCSPQGWSRDPFLVWRFYSERRAQAQKVRPNAAHIALAQLERRLGNRLFLCTQNVDPLHRAAGSRRVVHMHGELFKSRCSAEHRPPFEDDALYMTKALLPRCECGALIRPHICWFHEVPFEMDAIVSALDAATILVTIGSSGAVYPAAGFVRAAQLNGARTIYVGLEAPENAREFDECRLGRATEAVPALLAVPGVRPDSGADPEAGS